MDLDELRKNWEAFGATDPLWAILTDPTKAGGRWRPEEFFATGHREVEALMADIADLAPGLPRKRALDFGCGVGRVTQALGQHFTRVDGVDIAASMIGWARHYNRLGRRCRYTVNVRHDLQVFRSGAFDLIYSNLVLQHMAPEYMRRYLAEFIRVLRPGGVAIFQIPDSSDPPRPRAGRPHHARITTAVEPLALTVGERAPIRCELENLSDVRWPAPSDGRPIQLGNHWLDRHGVMLVQDDGRQPLPHDVMPGERAIVTLWVTSPALPGEYTLEIDLVQEFVTWFAAAGSSSLSIPVTVTGAAPAVAIDASVQPREPIAVMEMHCLPRSDVERVVTEAGGEVVEIRDYQVAGRLVSYRYAVTKPRPLGWRRWFSPSPRGPIRPVTSRS